MGHMNRRRGNCAHGSRCESANKGVDPEIRSCPQQQLSMVPSATLVTNTCERAPNPFKLSFTETIAPMPALRTWAPGLWWPKLPCGAYGGNPDPSNRMSTLIHRLNVSAERTALAAQRLVHAALTPCPSKFPGISSTASFGESWSLLMSEPATAPSMR